MPNAAAAANPPMLLVCSALRMTGTPVNRPLIPPNTASAPRVTTTESFNALWASDRNK